MNQKHYQNIYHLYANVILIVKNVIRIKSGITISVGVSLNIQIKHRVCEKGYFGNPATCNWKNM